MSREADKGEVERRKKARMRERREERKE